MARNSLRNVNNSVPLGSKVKSKQITNQHRDLILSISSVMTVALFFVSGIGSYRFFLVYAIYSLLKAFRVERVMMFVFFPAFVVTLYLDFANGPLFSRGTQNYFFIILLTFMVADYFINKFVKKLIRNISQEQYFVDCPSCHFNNIQLVEICANCSYKKGNLRVPSTAKISPFLQGDKITPGLLNLLTLGESEEILFHKRLTLFSQQLKNGERVVKKHLVVTTANLIILDYYSFHISMPKSWRERDVIPLLGISAIEGKMKEFYKTMRPFFMIKTINNDVYEIVLSTFGNYIHETNEIAALIKKANPQVEIAIELAETPLKKILNSLRPFLHSGH
jgi:hypothetical protein